MSKRVGRSTAALVGAMVALSVMAAPASASSRLVTTLSPSNEVPPNGSAASGDFNGRFTPYRGKVCYTLTFANLSAAATAAHVHHAPAGVNGPVVIPLTVPQATSGSVHQCMTGIDPALLKDIGHNPDQYYVNVHSSTFPGGEIRGQLAHI